MSAPTLVPVTIRTGMPSSSRTFRTPMCAMPRANPPPSATPMAGIRDDAGAVLRESSRPKACTVRMIFPRLFTANPTSTARKRPEGLNPTYLIRCHNRIGGCKGTTVPLGHYLGEHDGYSNSYRRIKPASDETPVFLLTCKRYGP